jgi:glycosyltransferase involved in cell wall biosynthesis
MKNKKVLIITYYWPPSGGSAVQRWLSLSNQLIKLGWDVFVLTVDSKYATFQLTDESLINDIDSRIHVSTTRTREPFPLFKMIFGQNSIPKPAFANETNPGWIKKISRFIRGNFFIPDPRKGWIPFAFDKAKELIDREGIGIVITAGPPHSTHFTGKKLKEEKGIRWVADFHDLWTDVIYYDFLYHLPASRKKDAALEKEILESADQILTVGEAYRQKLLSKSDNLNANHFHIIRIGYDETLFNVPSPARQEIFTVTYSGSIADFYQPDIFFSALGKIRKRHPDIAFRLEFAGILSDGIRKMAVENNLLDIFVETGYLSHQEAVKKICKATILLLVNPVTRDEKMVIPGKIYEYLAAKKPVCNITVTDAETANILAKNKAGETFNRNMEDQLTVWLESQVEVWKKNGNLDIVSDGAKAYSIRSIALQLDSEVLEDLLK